MVNLLQKYLSPEKAQNLLKLTKAVMLISAAPVTVIIVYFIMDRMLFDHAMVAIIAILAAATFFIHPYITNIRELTDYVKRLAEDKNAEEPDLSFLNNVEELNSAVASLHSSWQERRNQLESALSENKIVIEVLPDAIFIMDEDQKIVRTNGMARHMFGNRLSGKNLNDVLPVDKLLTTVRHVKQIDEIEFNLDDKIRRDFLGKVTKFPINSPSNTDTILTLHDLTELKQIRKMRADFVANASHEMKTPLASIIGLIETMQTSAKDDPDAQKEFLVIMADQADRMKKLISDLLSLSRIEADTSAPEEQAEITRVLEDAKKSCEVLAEKRNVEISLKVQKDLPNIRGEEDQLIQVFTNLISNSIKYGHPDSEVKVEAKISRKLPLEIQEQYDKALLVTVEDKSDGIPEEHIPRLTERFYRVDSARSRKLGGTGLGLAIVKHILNRHKALMKVKSVKGEGSEFNIYIPLGNDGELDYNVKKTA